MIFDFLGVFLFLFFREQQDETLGERLKQENHQGDETTAGQLCRPSAIRQEETHKGNMHTQTHVAHNI